MYEDHYAYTAPIAQVLADEYGTAFELTNTGGGCICLQAELESGKYLLIGSALDGPLMDGEERERYQDAGGYGAGVYDSTSGDMLAYASDHQATTAAHVSALVKTALDLSRERTATSHLQWERTQGGAVSVTRWEWQKAGGYKVITL